MVLVADAILPLWRKRDTSDYATDLTFLMSELETTTVLFFSAVFFCHLKK